MCECANVLAWGKRRTAADQERSRFQSRPSLAFACPLTHSSLFKDGRSRTAHVSTARSQLDLCGTRIDLALSCASESCFSGLADESTLSPGSSLSRLSLTRSLSPPETEEQDRWEERLRTSPLPGGPSLPPSWPSQRSSRSVHQPIKLVWLSSNLEGGKREADSPLPPLLLCRSTSAFLDLSSRSSTVSRVSSERVSTPCRALGRVRSRAEPPPPLPPPSRPSQPVSPPSDLLLPPLRWRDPSPSPRSSWPDTTSPPPRSERSRPLSLTRRETLSRTVDTESSSRPTDLPEERVSSSPRPSRRPSRVSRPSW